MLVEHDPVEFIVGRRAGRCGRLKRHGWSWCRFRRGGRLGRRLHDLLDDPLHHFLHDLDLVGGNHVDGKLFLVVLVKRPGAAAVDHPCGTRGFLGFRLLGEIVEIVLPDAASLVEPVEVDRHLVDGDLTEHVVEVENPVPSGLVEGQSEHLLVGQDLQRQVGEHAARACLDEDPRSGLVHRLDLLGELDRSGQMLAEQSGDLLGIGRIELGGCVGEDLLRRRGKLELVEVTLEAVLHLRDDRRMERARHGHLAGGESCLLELRHGILDALARPRDHGLHGRVEVGDPHAVDRFDDFLNLPALRLDSRHCAEIACRVAELALRALHDKTPPRLGQGIELLLVEHSRRAERHVLAVAVAGHGLGLDAERFHETEEPHVGGADRGLGHVGGHERLHVGLFLFLGEVRRREDVGVERTGKLIGQEPVGDLVALANLAEVERQHARHVGIGRTLPGEEKSNLALARQGAAREVDAAGIFHPLGVVLGEVAARQAELGFEIVERRGDDRQGGA